MISNNERSLFELGGTLHICDVCVQMRVLTFNWVREPEKNFIVALCLKIDESENVENDEMY